jgi:hypothetical protein
LANPPPIRTPQELLDQCIVQRRLVRQHGKQCADGIAKVKRPVHGRIVQLADADDIPHQKQPLGWGVPHGKRKVANELLSTILTPALVRTQDDLSVCGYCFVKVTFAP